jgi:hypothetical protein
MGAIEQALRKAIQARNESRYRTAKGAGMNYAALCRFLDESADIRLSSVEGLASHLELELVPMKRESKRGNRRLP